MSKVAETGGVGVAVLTWLGKGLCQPGRWQPPGGKGHLGLIDWPERWPRIQTWTLCLRQDPGPGIEAGSGGAAGREGGRPAAARGRGTACLRDCRGAEGRGAQQELGATVRLAVAAP